MDRHHPLHLLGVLPGERAFGVPVSGWGCEGPETSVQAALCLFPDPSVWNHVFRLSRPFLLDESDPRL